MPTQASASRSASEPDESATATIVDQTFSVGDQCRLVVENPRGRIAVTGWDRPEVRLQAVKLAEGSSLARFNATRVDLSQDGSAIFARTLLDGTAPLRDHGIWDDFAADAFRAFADLLRNTAMPAEVCYRVQVPRHAYLELRSVTGRIEVEGVRGTLRLWNVSGSERLERVQGDLMLSTVSGAIDARQAEGYFHARAVSGSIRAAGRLDAVGASTVSGSMELATPLAPSGSYDFRSVSGSITLRLAPDASATVAAHGVSMSVTSDLPCQVVQDVRRPGSRRWQGRLNGGAATIQIRTVSGHLYLTHPVEPAETPAESAPAQQAITAEDGATGAAPESPSEEAAESPTHGEPTPTGEAAAEAESEQLRILRALERGEIAVDQALQQLEEQRNKGH